MYKKKLGYSGEQIAINYYKSLGFILKDKNFTIRGGEIDLILQKNNLLIFVEVKVVNNTNDLFDFIKPQKIKSLLRTIDVYLWKNKICLNIRLDVVFIKNNLIYKVYSNITGNI